MELFAKRARPAGARKFPRGNLAAQRAAMPRSLPALGPDAVLVPRGLLRPTVATGAPVVAAHLKGDRALLPVDVRGVEAALRGDDVATGGAMHADALPRLAERHELLLHLGAPVGPIAPEDGRDTGVRQQEGVRSAHLVVVAELATDDSQVRRVVVLHEGDAPDGVAAHHAGQLPPAVQPREVVAMDGILQRVVHGEVVDRRDALRRVDVVLKHLHVAVPVLRHRVRVAHRAHILLLEPGAIAKHEIKTDGAEPDVVHQPLDERFGVFLHLLVRVVDVRGVLDVHPRGLSPLAGAGWVVPADRPRLPVGVLEAGPLAVAILLGGASVVDHDVRHRGDTRRGELLDQAPQLRIRPVFAVQVVPLARQVAAIVDAMGRRGQPRHVDASLLHPGHSTLDHVVPPVLVVAALPIEGLEQDVGLLVAEPGRLQLLHSLARHVVAQGPLVHVLVHGQERVRRLLPQLLDELALGLRPRHARVRQVYRRDLVQVCLALRDFCVLPIEDILVLPGVDVPPDNCAHALGLRWIAVRSPAPDVVGSHGSAAVIDRRLPRELDEVRRRRGHLQPRRRPGLSRRVRLHRRAEALLGLRALDVDGGDLVGVLVRALQVRVDPVQRPISLVDLLSVSVDDVPADLRRLHALRRIPRQSNSRGADLGCHDERRRLRRAQLLLNLAVLERVPPRVVDEVVLVARGLVPPTGDAVVAHELDAFADDPDGEALPACVRLEDLTRQRGPHLGAEDAVVDARLRPASVVQEVDDTLILFPSEQQRVRVLPRKLGAALHRLWLPPGGGPSRNIKPSLRWP
mmetsp:Transcript_64675/g.186009  ORF Transcript_64675/g.186009 Transcript_64675/m.186009 type:complete len:799 (+) Transcript_64675:111-2507(+)